MTQPRSQYVSIAQLVPFPDQPRPASDLTAESFADILPSIQAHGVQVPLIVRPAGGSDAFETIAGERRWRCAVLAGLTEVPVIIRELTDTQALFLALGDNEQRKNLHPMSVARTLDKIRQRSPEFNDCDLLASECHKPVAEVKQLLKYLQLVPLAAAAFEGRAVLAGHASLLASLPADQQGEALAACFSDVLVPADEARNVVQLLEARAWAVLEQSRDSFAAFKRWIYAHIVRPIDTAEVQTDMPEIAEAIEELADEGSALPQLSGLVGFPSRQAKALGVIPRHRWVEIRPEEKRLKPTPYLTNVRCEQMRPGVVTHGEVDVRHVSYQCSKRTCPVHWKRVEDAKSPAELAELQRRDRDRVRAERRAAAWEAVRPAARDAFARHLRHRAMKPLAILRATTDKHVLKRLEQEIGTRITDDKTAAAALVLKHLDSNNADAFATLAGACGFSLNTFTKRHAAAEKKAAAKLAKKRAA